MASNQGFKCPVSGCEVRIPDASSDVQKMFLETRTKDAHSNLIGASLQSNSESSGAKA